MAIRLSWCGGRGGGACACGAKVFSHRALAGAATTGYLARHNRGFRCHSSGVEHFIGNEEVLGSIPSDSTSELAKGCLIR